MKKIKVTVEYWGAWHTTTTKEYKVVKIVGAPTFAYSVRGTSAVARIGDMLSEAALENLASNIEVTTVPRA